MLRLPCHPACHSVFFALWGEEISTKAGVQFSTWDSGVPIRGLSHLFLTTDLIGRPYEVSHIQRLGHRFVFAGTGEGVGSDRHGHRTG